MSTTTIGDVYSIHLLSHGKDATLRNMSGIQWQHFRVFAVIIELAPNTHVWLSYFWLSKSIHTFGYPTKHETFNSSWHYFIDGHSFILFHSPCIELHKDAPYFELHESTINNCRREHIATNIWPWRPHYYSPQNNQHNQHKHSPDLHLRSAASQKSQILWGLDNFSFIFILILWTSFNYIVQIGTHSNHEM